MGKRTCTIEDCATRHYARGWCKMHYQRWARSGSPDRPPRTATDRFWSYVDRSDTNEHGCWIWTGGRVRGYGYFRPAADSTVQAYRYAYELANGPIPDGLEIDHRCRVKLCVRPDHLDALTRADHAKRSARARRIGDAAWRRIMLDAA